MKFNHLKDYLGKEVEINYMTRNTYWVLNSSDLRKE